MCGIRQERDPSIKKAEEEKRAKQSKGNSRRK